MNDIIGKRFGEWTVVSLNGRNNKGEQLYIGECSCGFIKKNHRSSLLRRGKTLQCKSCYEEKKFKKNELTGRKFGLWTVLEPIKKRDRNEWFYKCKCECGRIGLVPGYALRLGNATRCPNCRVKTHGMSKTKTFGVWSDMFQRCFNKNNKNYKNYGARGITVCERWFKFENFFSDMGLKPEKLQIDRINNDGNYEPDNCRWVTAKENCANRRISKKGLI